MSLYHDLLPQSAITTYHTSFMKPKPKSKQKAHTELD